MKTLFEKQTLNMVEYRDSKEFSIDLFRKDIHSRKLISKFWKY